MIVLPEDWPYHVRYREVITIELEEWLNAHVGQRRTSWITTFGYVCFLHQQDAVRFALQWL